MQILHSTLTLPVDMSQLMLELCWLFTVKYIIKDMLVANSGLSKNIFDIII